MNTPAHLIFGAAAFARPGRWRVNVAAILGGFLPDASLYFMVWWQMYVAGRTPREVFGHDYRDPFWQKIFAINNSVPLFAFVLAAGLLARSGVLIAFSGAALLHLALDLPLHHNDGRPHFWPFSDWIFVSPVSYWDPARHGNIVAPVEGLACVALAALLWRRFESRTARALLLAALALEAAPAIIFPIMFSGG